MKVGMIVHAYYEMDARVRRYAESLQEQGHDVHVYALRDKGKAPRETIAGVHLHRLPLSRRRGGTLRYIFEYAVFFWLSFFALTFRAPWRRYDVLHVHNMPDFLAFAGIVPMLFGTRIVLDVHDLMPEVYASKFKVSTRHPMIWPLRIQEWLAHRFAHRVIFATEIFRQIAIDRSTVRAKDSIAVMNAANTAMFDDEKWPWRGPDREGEFRLLYLGTVSHRHGVDQCVRVLAAARDRIPGIRMVLHPRFADGEGEPLQELLTLAKELQVDDLLEVKDPVPLERVPEVMSQASVGLFTPHMDVHIDVALSLKVPEYVAMGLPIVTVRTRIMESLFNEGEVLYFEDNDTEGFADQLVKLHADPQFARQLVERSKRFGNEHSWDAEFHRYYQLLQKIVPGAAIDPPVGKGVRSQA